MIGRADDGWVAVFSESFRLVARGIVRALLTCESDERVDRDSMIGMEVDFLCIDESSGWAEPRSFLGESLQLNW